MGVNEGMAGADRQPRPVSEGEKNYSRVGTRQQQWRGVGTCLTPARKKSSQDGLSSLQ